MTTVAKNEKGQSLLEFLIMLPLMLGLVALMTRVNTAIQASIVEQQYARAQTTWLTFNSPVYPVLRLQATELNGKNFNQMMIGVSDNLISSDSNLPVASTTMIARNPAVASRASNADQVDGPTSRALVRIRNTVTLCTQGNLQGGNAILPITTDGTSAAGLYNLPEATKIDYCKGPTQ
jgi:hypothetical protein